MYAIRSTASLWRCATKLTTAQPIARITPRVARTFSSYPVRYASSTTPTSSIKNPAEDESQRQLEIGTVALEAGNVPEAKLAYERAVSIFETSSAYFNLGVCHYHEKNIDKAIEAWKKTLQLSPDASDAHTNLASAYVMSVPSRPDLAIDHLKQAARLTPDDPEVQFNLGAVLEACEQLEEAAKAYEQARSGGIERAQENIRNVKSKILAARVAPDPKAVEAANEFLKKSGDDQSKSGQK